MFGIPARTRKASSRTAKFTLSYSYETGHRCTFSRDGQDPNPPVIFISNLSRFSSMGMLVLEAIRRLSIQEPGTELSVVDPEGLWKTWLTTSRQGSTFAKTNVPVHAIITPAAPELKFTHAA